MKKLLTFLVVLVFFIPCISFAQTTNTATYSPQYVALLQQLVKLLEEELAAVQPVTSSTASTTAVTAISTTATSTPVHGVYTTLNAQTGIYTHWNADGTYTTTCVSYRSVTTGKLVYGTGLCDDPSESIGGG